MKKTISLIILILVGLLVIIVMQIANNNAKIREVTEFNAQFEEFSGKQIYGTDVLSIINGAIDNNEKNNIEKDDQGYFIENDENSVKVEITLLSTNEDNEQIEVTRQMEALEQVGLDNFVSAFGITSFECTSIEYNSIGRVSKILIKQVEI